MLWFMAPCLLMAQVTASLKSRFARDDIRPLISHQVRSIHFHTYISAHHNESEFTTTLKILLIGACSLIGWMLTVKVEDRATVENIANYWWLNLSCPNFPDTSFSGATESKPRASTLPRKKHKERTFSPNSSSFLLSPLETSSLNQSMKLPKKGILKKLYNQVEYTSLSEHTDGSESAGNSKADISEDVERITTDTGRKRKGILKCNGKFSGVSPITSAPTWSHSFSKTSQEGDGGGHQDTEFEIKISLWKTHKSTGLQFPQNSYFDHAH